MPRYKATIDIYIEMGDRWTSDAEGNLADGISAMLTDVEVRTAEHGDDFKLIDWAYNSDSGSFRYAEPFEGQTPEEEHQESLTSN